MKDPEKQDDYFLKLSGKGNIPEPLTIGHNYNLMAQGTITSATESDKHDGSHVIYFRFEPVIIEVVDDRGKSIRAKDTRSLSQLFRARVWKEWSKRNDGVEFNSYYENLMSNMLQQVEEIVEMYGLSTGQVDKQS